jgi:hypothetical protein
MKYPLNLFPIEANVPIIVTVMMVAIKAYSMAVAPDLSARKCLISIGIAGFLDTGSRRANSAVGRKRATEPEGD